MIGAGVLHLPPVRHAFPILKSRLLPQKSGKFKKSGFAGQALDDMRLLSGTRIRDLTDNSRTGSYTFQVERGLNPERFYAAWHSPDFSQRLLSFGAQLPEILGCKVG